MMVSSTASTGGKGVIDRRLPPEVLAFCRQHELLPFVEGALALAESSFSPAPLSVVLDEDYETGEERVVIEAAVDMTSDQAAERYDAYVRQWVAFAPPYARYRVGLSLDVRGGHEPA